MDAKQDDMLRTRYESGILQTPLNERTTSEGKGRDGKRACPTPRVPVSIPLSLDVRIRHSRAQ